VKNPLLHRQDVTAGMGKVDFTLTNPVIAGDNGEVANMKRIASFVFITIALLWRPLIAAEDTSLPAGIKNAGGDGSTVASAVIITGGNDTSTIEAEHAWLHQHVPGAKVTK
jgi:hypothetical protein